jgi:hypothetical protein
MMKHELFIRVSGSDMDLARAVKAVSDLGVDLQFWSVEEVVPLVGSAEALVQGLEKFLAKTAPDPLQDGG